MNAIKMTSKTKKKKKKRREERKSIATQGPTSTKEHQWHGGVKMQPVTASKGGTRNK